MSIGKTKEFVFPFFVISMMSLLFDRDNSSIQPTQIHRDRMNLYWKTGILQYWQAFFFFLYLIDYHGPLLVHIQGVNLPYCYRWPGKDHLLHGGPRRIRTHGLCVKMTVQPCVIALVRLTTKTNYSNKSKYKVNDIILL